MSAEPRVGGQNSKVGTMRLLTTAMCDLWVAMESSRGPQGPQTQPGICQERVAREIASRSETLLKDAIDLPSMVVQPAPF